MLTAITPLFESIEITRWLLLIAFGVFFSFMGLLFKTIWQTHASKKQLIAPALIIVAGLLVRLGWIIATQPEPLSDFLIYWQYANAFTAGDLTYTELSRHPGIIVLYSWFFQWFGATLTTAWGVNLLFAGLMLTLIYQLGRQLFGDRTGLIALSISAFFPQLITYTALLASETPAITFFLLVLWAVLQTQRSTQNTEQTHVSHGLGYWFALGIMLYATILLRSSAMIFIGLIPLLFILFRRTHWKQCAQQFIVMALTTAMLLSTWIVHQNMIGGSPKMFWGTELWLGCAIQYDRGGRYTHPKDLAFYDKVKPYYEAGTQEGLVKAYAIIGEESMKVIQADPIKYLQYGFVRMKNILWTSQTGIRWSQRGSSLMAKWPQKWINKSANVSTILWQILLIGSGIGFLAILASYLFKRPLPVSNRSAAQQGLFFIAAFLGIWIVFHYLIAVASERYAFQIIPFVILLFSGGLTTLFSLVQSLRLFTKSQPDPSVSPDLV